MLDFVVLHFHAMLVHCSEVLDINIGNLLLAPISALIPPN
jgi:hypothetical protein